MKKNILFDYTLVNIFFGVLFSYVNLYYKVSVAGTWAAYSILPEAKIDIAYTVFTGGLISALFQSIKIINEIKNRVLLDISIFNSKLDNIIEFYTLLPTRLDNNITTRSNFIKHLDKVRNDKSWLLAKFLSLKLYFDFDHKETESLSIKNVTSDEYAKITDILSGFADKIFLSSPYSPTEYFKSVWGNEDRFDDSGELYETFYFRMLKDRNYSEIFKKLDIKYLKKISSKEDCRRMILQPIDNFAFLLDGHCRENDQTNYRCTYTQCEEDILCLLNLIGFGIKYKVPHTLISLYVDGDGVFIENTKKRNGDPFRLDNLNECENKLIDNSSTILDLSLYNNDILLSSNLNQDKSEKKITLYTKPEEIEIGIKMFNEGWDYGADETEVFYRLLKWNSSLVIQWFKSVKNELDLKKYGNALLKRKDLDDTILTQIKSKLID